jgi:hypothetical protein
MRPCPALYNTNFGGACAINPGINSKVSESKIIFGAAACKNLSATDRLRVDAADTCSTISL